MQRDLVRIIEEKVRTRAALPAMYFMVGIDDKDYVDDNRAFHAALQNLHVPHEYHEWSGVHEWSFWYRHEREVLYWISLQLKDSQSVSTMH